MITYTVWTEAVDPIAIQRSPSRRGDQLRSRPTLGQDTHPRSQICLILLDHDNIGVSSTKNEMVGCPGFERFESRVGDDAGRRGCTAGGTLS